MVESNLALRCVSELAASAQHLTKFSRPDQLQLSQLNLYLRSEEADLTTVADGVRYVVAYDCSTDQMEQGIVIVAVGFGHTEVDAARDAALQWFIGVFPVLVQWRANNSAPARHGCLVSECSLRLRDSAAPAKYRALLGPLIARGVDNPLARTSDVVVRYFEHLRGRLEELQFWGSLHWLECFVARHDDGRVLATCRLDNRDWKDGESLLRAAYTSFGSNVGGQQSVRQFILLCPAAEESTPSDEPNELAHVTPKVATWWHRLLQRRPTRR